MLCIDCASGRQPAPLGRLVVRTPGGPRYDGENPTMDVLANGRIARDDTLTAPALAEGAVT